MRHYLMMITGIVLVLMATSCMDPAGVYAQARKFADTLPGDTKDVFCRNVTRDGSRACMAVKSDGLTYTMTCDPSGCTLNNRLVVYPSMLEHP